MPTILRIKNYRFFFFSREETRQHIHIQSPNGEAKFWLKPNIELATNYKLSDKELAEIKKIIKINHQEFLDKWEQYFAS
jgi:hypothetical protein